MNKKTAIYTKEVFSVWLDFNTDAPSVVLDGKFLYYTLNTKNFLKTKFVFLTRHTGIQSYTDQQALPLCHANLRMFDNKV